MKQKFRNVKLRKSSMEIVEQANDILSRYAEQGYDLSLRQLYYQFVASNLLTNTEQSYNRLGAIISDARDAGLVDWSMIRDRGRSVEKVSTWDSPADVVDAALQSYRRDLWENQPCWVLCMVEKQALEGVLTPVCVENRIAFSANKGYASSSHMYEIGRTIYNRDRAGKEIHVIYLGDHDPSGIDMTRDIAERLELYSRVPGIEVHRVALNMDQVDQYGPPPNPAKMTDSRANGYVDLYGDESWELDALDPSLLAQLVTDQILDVRDDHQWEQDEAQETAEIAQLQALADEYRERTGQE